MKKTAKKISQLKKELIGKINAKVGKATFDIQEENLMAQFIDKYQYEQIITIQKDKVHTEDAEAEENEFSLDELSVDVLADIASALKIK